MNLNTKSLKTLTLAGGLVALLTPLVACEKNAGTFSLAADSTLFQQSATFVPRKLDVLFVIDNSGSMATSQTNLASHFPSFINYFKTKGYDFKIAITTTDTYLAEQFVGQNCVLNSVDLCDASYAKFHATALSGQSPVYVIDNNTPNLEQVFSSNVVVGTGGSGDERAFSSFHAALQSNQNTGFHRNDAYLSIIIVSDADDFSHTSGTWHDNPINESYSEPSLISINDYVTYLNTFTSGQPTTDYSVSTIGVLDTTCRNSLGVEMKLGTRYMALSDATGGTKNSICESFDTVLNNISTTIASQTKAVFTLDRTPIPATIRVIINDVVIPEDASNGWQYSSTNNTVTVNGTYAPQSGDAVRINFDPASLTN